MSAARAKAGGEPALGIIGGSGLYEMEGIEDLRWVRVRTPFGDPSDAYGTGRLGDRRVIFLPRHGRGHRITPTEINYRANIYGLKALGARWIISVSAVGSMKEEIHPLDLVIPDQFYDHTRRRVSTFFGDGIVGHVGMAEPVCPALGDLLETGSREAGARVHRGGTYICIEGPQFSTRGESQIYRRWGVSVIGMTNMPEAKLAREAELCYATLALATDYDVWHDEPRGGDGGGGRGQPAQERGHREGRAQARDPAGGQDLRRRVRRRARQRGDHRPKAFPPRTRKRLGLLLDRYFPPKGKGRRG